MEIENPSSDSYTIYSKSGCTYCTKAKKLLETEKEKFIVIDCDEYLIEDKITFLEYIKLLIGREYKTFPMIFKEGFFIGGFTELYTIIHKKNIITHSKSLNEIDMKNNDFPNIL